MKGVHFMWAAGGGVMVGGGGALEGSREGVLGGSTPLAVPRTFGAYTLCIGYS